MNIINRFGWKNKIRVQGDYIESAIAIQSIHGNDSIFVYDTETDLLFVTGNADIFSQKENTILMGVMLLNNT